MNYLVKGIVATGDNAYHAGETSAPSSPARASTPSSAPRSPSPEANDNTSEAEETHNSPVTPAVHPNL